MLLTAISFGRNARRKVERRLVVGLVPARNEATRVGGLELGEQRPRVLAFLVLVVEREQTVRLRVDLARIGERRAGSCRARALCGNVTVAVCVLGVDRDPAGERRPPLPDAASPTTNFKIGRVEDQLARRLDDVEVDRDRRRRTSAARHAA